MCDLDVNVAYLLPSLRYHFWGAPLFPAAQLGACPLSVVFDHKIIRSHSGKYFYFILLGCLITSNIKIKALLVIFVIQYTIYLTLESIVFRSYHHWCSKGVITIKRKISKRQASKYLLSQGVSGRS